MPDTFELKEQEGSSHAFVDPFDLFEPARPSVAFSLLLNLVGHLVPPRAAYKGLVPKNGIVDDVLPVLTAFALSTEFFDPTPCFVDATSGHLHFLPWAVVHGRPLHYLQTDSLNQ